MSAFALDRHIIGDCREVLRAIPAATFQCCVTSPPYLWLRDYGHKDQIGQEDTVNDYVTALVGVFREVRRVLRADGTLWLVLGDTYVGAAGGGQGANGQMSERSVTAARVRTQAKIVAGLKPKDLVGVPWRVAFALQADGWWLRADTIWAKSNPMPESVKDRPTKAHEYVFLLAKSARYYFSDTRNARSVWTIPTQPSAEPHFAAMPEELVRRCVAAGSRDGDAVLDPFLGTGTVGRVAGNIGRRWFGIELQPGYEPIIRRRTAQAALPLKVSAP